MKFVFREGSRISSKIKPVKAGRELERIRKKNKGKLLSKDVVEESRPEVAPLHPAFEWLDSKAAEAFRQIQARNLIRSVRVVHEEGEPAESKYVHVESVGQEQGYYQDLSVAVKNVDEYQRALKELLIKLSGCERAVGELRAKADEQGKESEAALIGIAMNALVTARGAVEKVAVVH